MKERGVYTLPCTVNGLKLRFVLDTGAGQVTISVVEALFMLKNGYLDEDDIRGTSFARLANGEVTQNTEVLLRVIEIGDLRLQNVTASIIHSLAAPLLLGQSAIERLGVVELDGELLKITPNSITRSPTSTTPGGVKSILRGYHAVYPNTPLYDTPDNEGRIITQCQGMIYVFGPGGNGYVRVRYGNHTGFVRLGSVK